MNIKRIDTFGDYQVYIVKTENKFVFDTEDFCKEMNIQPERYSEIEAQAFVKGNAILATVLVPRKYVY